MLRTLMFAPLLAATVLAISPAMAQTAHQRDRAQTRQPYQQPYRQSAPGWTTSDPSFGYFPNQAQARALGRCVEDLGYGRFEYCD